MPGYRVSYLSRDDRGRFVWFSREILAQDHEEAWSWALHRDRNGRGPVESEIETRNTLTGDVERHPSP